MLLSDLLEFLQLFHYRILLLLRLGGLVGINFSEKSGFNLKFQLLGWVRLQDHRGGWFDEEAGLDWLSRHCIQDRCQITANSFATRGGFYYSGERFSVRDVCLCGCLFRILKLGRIFTHTLGQGQVLTVRVACLQAALLRWLQVATLVLCLYGRFVHNT